MAECINWVSAKSIKVRHADTNFISFCKSKGPYQQELLSNLVFEDCWSCGDLVRVGGFNSVFESNAGDDLGEIIKAA